VVALRSFASLPRRPTLAALPACLQAVSLFGRQVNQPRNSLGGKHRLSNLSIQLPAAW